MNNTKQICIFNKKVILLLLIMFNFSFANEKMMDELLNNVLLKNTAKAMIDAKTLEKSLTKKQNIKILQKDFSIFVSSWKKVETFYLAADFNEEVIDTPRYIDVFHNLKENLFVQMQRVIDSKDDVNVEMYKHSFKTINALEYVLFSQNYNKRKNEIAVVIVKNIIKQLEIINNVYINNNKKFLSEFKWANDLIINSLIDSSFKLKDWRIGDIAGLSRKYKNKPSNKRAEYFLSKNSKNAIVAIIYLHKEVMDSKEYDFGDMLIKNGYKKEVTEIREMIALSINNLKYLKNENFEDENIKKLYESITKLHVSYYASLVNALGVTSKILDADGD